MSNGLLRPTLSDFPRVPALYHSTGFFLSAFFGGPVGAGIYALANTARLSRLATDGAVILIVMAAAFFTPLEIARQGGLVPLGELLGANPRQTGELLLRALGLACFGAIYFRQRRFFRAATVAGVSVRAVRVGTAGGGVGAAVSMRNSTPRPKAPPTTAEP